MGRFSKRISVRADVRDPAAFSSTTASLSYLNSSPAHGFVTARGPTQPAVSQWPRRTDARGSRLPRPPGAGPRGHRTQGKRRSRCVRLHSLSGSKRGHLDTHAAFQQLWGGTPFPPAAWLHLGCYSAVVGSRASPPSRSSGLRVPGVTPRARRVPFRVRACQVVTPQPEGGQAHRCRGSAGVRLWLHTAVALPRPAVYKLALSSP